MGYFGRLVFGVYLRPVSSGEGNKNLNLERCIKCKSLGACLMFNEINNIFPIETDK